jgi:hypothetical protein
MISVTQKNAGKVRGIVLGFMAGFGTRNSDFYAPLWGRGILVSMARLGGE